MRVVWLMSALAVALCSPSGSPGPPLGESEAPVDQLPMEARDSETMLDDGEVPEDAPLVAPFSPPSLLNGGKPFFLEKDPVTGAVDFSSTKTAPAIAPAQDAGNNVPDYEYEEHDGIDRKDTVGTGGRPNDLGGAFKIVTPNFHDFLNLPVKYSSSGDKYPLISSSYANTKVQGMGGTTHQTFNGGSGNIKNHKPYPSSASSTQAPHYYSIPSKPSSTSTNPPSTTSTSTSTTTTTTTTTTTARPKTKPPPSSFWGLLSGSDEEYVDQPPEGSFGVKPAKVPSPAEERPTDYEYSYEDGDVSGPSASVQGPAQRPFSPQNSHQPQPTVPQTTSPSTTTISTTTTTTTTPMPTVRPTTRRPQLSTVKILKPFSRTPVVITARPADPSTTAKPVASSTIPPSTTTQGTSAATTRSTRPSTTEEKPQTRPLEISSTVSLPSPVSTPMTIATSANVVLVPEKSSSAVPTQTPMAPNKVVFEGPSYPRPNPNRDSPYGVAANQPFRPLYDNLRPPYQPGQMRPPPPPGLQYGGVPPSAFGDVITVPLPSDQSGSENYVSFSFQPPSPQQLRPAPSPSTRPQPPRFPGVEPPHPNPPVPFHQGPPPTPPPKIGRPPPPVREEPELVPPPPSPIQTQVNENMEHHAQPSTPNPSSTEKQIPTTSATSAPGKVVFPDEKRDQVLQDTKEIVVHGSFQHPSQLGGSNKVGVPPRPPHFGQGTPPYRGPGQVLDGQLPPYRRPVLPQSDDMTPPFHQMSDSNREGSEQQATFQLPPGASVPAQPATDLMPPADPGKIRAPHPVNDYPRPHWENTRPKPPGQGPHPIGFQGMRPKVDGLGPPPYKTMHRIKPGQGMPAMGSLVKMQNPQVPSIGDTSPDPGLPNILPQFRPNARLSGGHGPIPQPIQHQRMPLMERPGAGRPHSILPAAPPSQGGPQLQLQPQAAALLRVNRNDDSAVLTELEIAGELSPDAPSPAPQRSRPVLHRRSGPPPPVESRRRVATLQMMKQQGAVPTHRVLTRAELPALPGLKPPFPGVPAFQDKSSEQLGDRPPVFVVYPVNAVGTALKRPGATDPEDGGVVVGSLGLSKPIPPSNLKVDSGEDILTNMEDEQLPLSFTSHKQQKPLLNPSRDRTNPANDGPILKPHLNKPAHTKMEFPYAIVQPDVPDQFLSSGDDTVRHNTAVADKRKDDHAVTDNHDDTEINVIPYLQDYMPFATKKPPPPLPQVSKDELSLGQDARIVVGSGTSAPPSSLQPISVTLRTVSRPPAAIPPAPHSHSDTASAIVGSGSPYFPRPLPGLNSQSGPPSHHETVIGGTSGGSEFTVGAVMHTLSNHRQTEGQVAVAAHPQPDSQGFQAPFQASVSVEPSVEAGSAPVREGWSVVNSNDSSMKPGTVDRADIRDIIKENLPVTGVATPGAGDNSTFDFENFKPQLFGGFKPILPSDDISETTTKGNAPVHHNDERERTLSEVS